MAKNNCKQTPAQTWSELKANAEHAFKTHVTEKTWRGVHKKVIEWEDFYLEGLGADVPIYHEDDIDEGEVDDGGDGDAEEANQAALHAP